MDTCQSAQGTLPLTCMSILANHPVIGRDDVLGRLFNDLGDVASARARLDLRSERNAVGFDRAMNTIEIMALASLAPALMTGDTENQQTVSPGRTGTPEAAIDSIGTANAATATANAEVAANIAKLASALVPLIVGASGLSLSPVQLAQAVLAAVTAASGAGAAAAAGK